MADTLEHGRRPFLHDNSAPDVGKAFSSCPGTHLEHFREVWACDGIIAELSAAWGPVLAVWEGHASDYDIRYAGSSGGAASALALYCMERQSMCGTLHVAARPDIPYLNETTYSKTREDLLRHTGSRYAPSSPCDGLEMIENASGKSVFIGKPCDIAAVRRAAEHKPELAHKLGLTIGIFCAGAPSTLGTLELLKEVGFSDPASILSLRYRGMGWPGEWVAKSAEGNRCLSYSQSWGYLQRFRPWRCYICPDHSGEFADIAVGDPWYRKIEGGDTAGSSLIIARTQRGLDAILAAERDGYLVLEIKDHTLLPRSQPNLLKARGALWGRLLGLRLLGAPIPRYYGFPMFRFWVSELDVWEKIQSVAGTVKRVFSKKLRQRIKMARWLP